MPGSGGWKLMQIQNRFWLSSVAIAVGVLLASAWAGNVARGEKRYPPENPIAGFSLILGTLAYRSAKRTRLGLRKASRLRTCLEYAALSPSIIFPLWVFVHVGGKPFVELPLTWTVVPLGACIAFFLMKRDPGIRT